MNESSTETDHWQGQADVPLARALGDAGRPVLLVRACQESGEAQRERQAELPLRVA